jgi:hypothetical protein
VTVRVRATVRKRRRADHRRCPSRRARRLIRRGHLVDLEAPRGRTRSRRRKLVVLFNELDTAEGLARELAEFEAGRQAREFADA